MVGSFLSWEKRLWSVKSIVSYTILLVSTLMLYFGFIYIRFFACPGLDGLSASSATLWFLALQLLQPLWLPYLKQNTFWDMI